jgi:hypothetical protein
MEVSDQLQAHPAFPPGKSSPYPLDRRLDGSQRREKSCSAGNRTRAFQPVVIPTELFLLKFPLGVLKNSIRRRVSGSNRGITGGWNRAVTVMICNPNGPGSNLGPDADYPDRRLRWFPSPLPGQIPGQCLILGHDHIRRHSFQFKLTKFQSFDVTERHRWANPLRELCIIRSLVSEAAKINAMTTLTGCNYYNFRVKGLQLIAARGTSFIISTPEVMRARSTRSILIRWKARHRLLYTSDYKRATNKQTKLTN